jgi:hypothetical protein
MMMMMIYLLLLDFDGDCRGDCRGDCNTDTRSIFVFVKISSASLGQMLLQYNDLVLEIY